MTAFFWKLRFALRFWRIVRLPFPQAWLIADSAWEWNRDCTPAEAVDDELDAWRDSQ